MKELDTVDKLMIAEMLIRLTEPDQGDRDVHKRVRIEVEDDGRFRVACQGQFPESTNIYTFYHESLYEALKLAIYTAAEMSRPTGIGAMVP